MAGYTLAFLLGMPLGTILGDAFGWRRHSGLQAE
jgi:predicted MFS family arabinose efflux permease